MEALDDQPAEVKGQECCEALIHSDDREAWLERREIGIGASESAIILGLSHYKSVFTLFQERTGGIPRNREDNRYKDWGKRLEHVIAQWFHETTERPVVRDGWLRRSLLYPWLLATPDYDQSDPEKGRGLLECKTADSLFREDWHNAMPLSYQCQLQHQLVVTGKGWGSLAVLIGGNDPRYGDIEAHPRFQGLLIRATEIFWRQLRGELPPPAPDAHPSSSKTLMHMVESGQAVTLPDIALRWHEENVRYAALESEARQRKEEYRDLLRSCIGTASYGILPSGAGMYAFTAVERPTKIIPASRTRELRHRNKVYFTQRDAHPSGGTQPTEPHANEGNPA